MSHHCSNLQVLATAAATFCPENHTQCEQETCTHKQAGKHPVMTGHDLHVQAGECLCTPQVLPPHAIAHAPAACPALATHPRAPHASVSMIVKPAGSLVVVTKLASCCRLSK